MHLQVLMVIRREACAVYRLNAEYAPGEEKHFSGLADCLVKAFRFGYLVDIGRFVSIWQRTINTSVCGTYATGGTINTSVCGTYAKGGNIMNKEAGKITTIDEYIAAYPIALADGSEPAYCSIPRGTEPDAGFKEGNLQRAISKI